MSRGLSIRSSVFLCYQGDNCYFYNAFVCCFLSVLTCFVFFFFFFQAEDGIRDPLVTGVQTCALPISIGRAIIRRCFLLPEMKLGRGSIAGLSPDLSSTIAVDDRTAGVVMPR